jgi:hypothetical protein
MGVSGQYNAPAALYPRGKDPPVPIVQEAGWAPEPVWTQRLEEKSFASAAAFGDETSRQTDGDTDVTSLCVNYSFAIELFHV